MSDTPITWVVNETPWKRTMRAHKDALGDNYEADKATFKEFMESYFDAVPGCTAGLGKTIRPLGKALDGGKALKVRWGTPGCGKSGGLRMVLSAHCENRTVRITYAVDKKSLPEKTIEKEIDAHLGPSTTSE